MEVFVRFKLNKKIFAEKSRLHVFSKVNVIVHAGIYEQSYSIYNGILVHPNDKKSKIKKIMHDVCVPISAVKVFNKKV